MRRYFPSRNTFEMFETEKSLKARYFCLHTRLLAEIGFKCEDIFPLKILSRCLRQKRDIFVFTRVVWLKSDLDEKIFRLRILWTCLRQRNPLKRDIFAFTRGFWVKSDLNVKIFSLSKYFRHV